jgi:hypothetical protein
MTTTEDRAPNPDDTGYGAAREGDRDDAPDQAQQHREPPSEHEAEQDDYANTDAATDDG